MTNLDRWKYLTEALESPDNYLELSLLFAVSSALERRVWYGDATRPLFCNMYGLLVGPPAIGKGTSMREGGKLLTKFGAKRPDGSPLFMPDSPNEARPLFYKLPDATTFEDLVHNIANCTLPIKLPNGDTKSQAAAYFLLEELSSLLRRNKTEEVGRFLLNMYDCTDYKYSTRKAGKATIKNGCLNLLAGTQLDFVRKAEKEGLLGEGLFSRFIMVYEERRRQVKFHIGGLTDTHKEYQLHIQLWLAQLSKLYGQLEYETADIHDYLEEWWKNEVGYLERFRDSKLADFFSRRKDHVLKLAAAYHFLDNATLVISLNSFKKAIAFTKQLESGVIRIANKSGRNSFFPVQERLITFIRERPRILAEIIRFLETEMDFVQIMNTVNQLTIGGRIIESAGTYTAPPENNETL